MTYHYGPQFDNWQRNIVLGTILGGSSVQEPRRGVNCYLTMRGKDLQWLQYKAYELQNFAPQHPFVKDKATNRWHSNCYPVFNEMRELFYNDSNKIVRPIVLDELKDIGLAVWFLDSGRMIKDKARMRTGRYKPECIGAISDYFNILDMDHKLSSNSLTFSKKSTIKFLKVIAPVVPEFMHCKLQISG